MLVERGIFPDVERLDRQVGREAWIGVLVLLAGVETGGSVA